MLSKDAHPNVFLEPFPNNTSIAFSAQTLFPHIYSLVRLVWPNTEELISRAFFGSIKDLIAPPGPYEPQGILSKDVR